MSTLDWNESMSVGFEPIDSQHRELVQILNDLFDADAQGHDKEILSDILTRLINYTREHFSAEERYFDKFGYPWSDAHKDEHRKLLQQVNTFKESFDAGETVLTDEIRSFLTEWVVHHIMGSDKKFGRYLYEQKIR